MFATLGVDGDCRPESHGFRMIDVLDELGAREPLSPVEQITLGARERITVIAVTSRRHRRLELADTGFDQLQTPRGHEIPVLADRPLRKLVEFLALRLLRE